VGAGTGAGAGAGVGAGAGAGAGVGAGDGLPIASSAAMIFLRSSGFARMLHKHKRHINSLPANHQPKCVAPIDEHTAQLLVTCYIDEVDLVLGPEFLARSNEENILRTCGLVCPCRHAPRMLSHTSIDQALTSRAMQRST
jgi:hypothetical protein